MRVLHVTAPGAVGGLERVVHGLAVGMHARGHDVAVFASTASAGRPPFLASLAEAGVTVHHTVTNARAYHTEIRGILAAIAESSAEVVHAHGFRSDVLALIAARYRRRAAVSTVHGFTGGDATVRLYERIQIAALKRFDAVVAVSQPLAAMFTERGFDTRRLHVVRNALLPGADPLDRCSARHALGLPDEGPLIGWVGRFGTEKGPDVFVDAIGRLDGDICGVMLGDGPDRESVAARARDGGFAQRLILPGVVPGADRYLRAFDMLVVSSRTEGTPMILLEAMAAGVPVVTTAVGGIPDVVGPDEALFARAVDGAAVAEAIDAALADPASAADRARRAEARLHEHFGVEPWLDGYEQIYRAALERRSR